MRIPLRRAAAIIENEQREPMPLSNLGSVTDIGAGTCAQRRIPEAPAAVVDAGDRASAFKSNSGSADNASAGFRPGRFACVWRSPAQDCRITIARRPHL